MGGVKSSFHLLIQLDPCQFGVYDSNMDGVITREEIQAVFAEDGHLAETLFGALDSIKGVVFAHICLYILLILI